MRADVVTIFPEYLAPARLSIVGRAVGTGALDLRVHDLRAVTTDRHRTVDDTPYGGGAGMVMTPEPWARTLDAVFGSGATRPRLIVPSPAGRVFNQGLAAELAAQPWLVFACGRYEGIDERVLEWASEHAEVSPVSLGDYVLCGGEVAVLVLLEATVRLLPGVLGNAQSLVEESHQDGLLEYPVYTKPASWRGRQVPPVLLGGDHAAIARWRHDQRLQRTAQRRGDLLRSAATITVDDDGPAVTTDSVVQVRAAVPADAGELFTLQRACWVDEALANPGIAVPAIHETLDDVRSALARWTTLVVVVDGRVVASVRGRADGQTWLIGRLMVAPDLRGRGLGRWLLARIEALAAPSTHRAALYTGAGSTANHRMYRKAGYRPIPGEVIEGAILLGKPLAAAGP